MSGGEMSGEVLLRDEFFLQNGDLEEAAVLFCCEEIKIHKHGRFGASWRFFIKREVFQRRTR